MNLTKLRLAANSLYELNKLENAYYVYDTISESILNVFAIAQNSINDFSRVNLKKHSKELINFKDHYLNKVFFNYCESAFDLNHEQVYNELQLSLFGAIKCVSQSNTLSALINREMFLSKSLLLENLVIDQHQNLTQIIPKTLTLVLENDKSLKIRPNFTVDFISNQILRNSKKIINTDFAEINECILDFLFHTGDTNSELFIKLKTETNYRFNFKQKSNKKSYHKHEYEEYERYEKYESYERYERRRSFDDDIDLTKATEFEKATYFGKLFGLKGRITKSQIRKIYIELINQYHPDKVSHLGEEIKNLAERKTKLINLAYDFFKKKYNL